MQITCVLSFSGCFYYFNSTINPILYSVMSNRFRVAFREKLCSGPPSLWCICCCCFCCVKDFEKRSQQQTPHFYRNSNSHSSVRSYVSYPQLKAGINNNTLPRVRSMAVDFKEKVGVVTSTWPNNDMEMADKVVLSPSSSSPSRRYGRTLTVSPPLSHRHIVRIESGHSHSSNRSSSKSSDNRRPGTLDSSSSGKEDEIDDNNDIDLAEELDEALRPELDKLEEAEKNDCVNCTNCTLLFPPKLRNAAIFYEAVEKTSTTELSQSDQATSEAVKQDLIESCV